MPYIPGLDRLLSVGARYTDEHAVYVIEQHPLGDVVLPTGQVVGCDPLVNPDAAPFTVTVPAGRYPLRAWVAVLYQRATEWQRRVAALQLVVRDDPAARWEPALVEGQDLSTLSEDAYFGYPVDAGAGTLTDMAAVRALASWDYERLDDVYIPPQFPGAPVPGAIGAVTDEPTGTNVVIVGSGWGDGLYPTFIGDTAAGAVASFVTDFMVIPAGKR
jgi:hypothetical protein